MNKILTIQQILDEINIHTKEINYLSKLEPIDLPKIRLLTQFILDQTKTIRTRL